MYVLLLQPISNIVEKNRDFVLYFSTEEESPKPKEEHKSLQSHFPFGGPSGPQGSQEEAGST